MSNWRMGKRTVVFLGAGASQPLGFPLTKDILPAIWSGLNPRRPAPGWTRWGGLKDHPSEARRLRKFLRILLPGLGSRRTVEGGSSIVDVMSLIDQLILEGRSPHPEYAERDLREGRHLLHIGINGVLQGRRRRKAPQLMAQWVLREATESPRHRVTLVSTNYDTAYEQALFTQLIRQKISVGQAVDMGMPWRDAFKRMIHVRPRGARLAVLKLHGSLNWVRCETCGYVSVNVTQRIATVGWWRTKKRLSFNQCTCGGWLRSVLVTPSIVRDVRDANLLGLWTAALEDLRMADEWILIGYSMPPEDIAIRSLLLRAWHARRRRRLRVRVVQYQDPEDKSVSDELQRYRMFFPKGSLKPSDYSRNGVEAFLQSLPTLKPRALAARMNESFPHAERYLRQTV